MKKKVLIISDNLSAGGSARQISLLSSSLAKEEIIVDIFFYKHNYKEIFYKNIFKEKNINLICLKIPKYKKGFSIKVFYQLFKLIKKGNYSIIISFQLIPSIYTFFSCFFIFKKVKKIFSLRNAPVSLKNFDKLKIFLMACYFDKLIVNSFAFRDYLLSRNILFKKFLSQKVMTILNGYDFISNVEDIKSRKNPSNILVLSRVNPIKGGIVFAEAMILLFKKRDAFTQVKWAGNIDKEPYSKLEYEKMNSKINSCEALKKNWVWEGQVSDINKLYKWADLIVIPSLSEGMSNVLCESFCRGKFVISTKVGDYSFLIGDERGIVCETNSPTSLCNAIEKFFALSYQERLKISINSLKFAKENFLIKRTKNEYLNLI